MSDEHLIRPRDEKSFFIGWEPTPPAVDRRFLLGAAFGLTVAGGASAGLLATAQQGPGDGTWNMADVRDWVGFLRTEPYPVLQLAAEGEPSRHALLFCATKCGVRDRLAGLADGPVVVRGSPLQRGSNRAIAVADGPDWIRAADDAASRPRAATQTRALGAVELEGEILDSKCWFGAMRPGAGKTHKACAALCIRYGIPPSFYARTRDGAEHALLMTTPNGGALGEAILPLVADRVRVAGELELVGDDLLTFRVDPGAIRRI